LPRSKWADRAGGHLSTILGKGAISPRLLRQDNGSHILKTSNAPWPLSEGNRFKNAPLSVIVVPVPVAPGDRGVWKKAQHRHHKAIRLDPPWRPQLAIPAGDRDALRRAARGDAPHEPAARRGDADRGAHAYQGGVMPQVVGKEVLVAIKPILASSQHPPGIAASSGTPPGQATFAARAEARAGLAR
jgi:hypothetical protein